MELRLDPWQRMCRDGLCSWDAVGERQRDQAELTSLWPDFTNMFFHFFNLCLSWELIITTGFVGLFLFFRWANKHISFHFTWKKLKEISGWIWSDKTSVMHSPSMVRKRRKFLLITRVVQKSLWAGEGHWTQSVPTMCPPTHFPESCAGLYFYSPSRSRTLQDF